jgi:hypothetical protein
MWPESIKEGEILVLILGRNNNEAKKNFWFEEWGAVLEKSHPVYPTTFFKIRWNSEKFGWNMLEAREEQEKKLKMRRWILRKFGLTIPRSFLDEIHWPWGRTTRSRVEPIYWQMRLNPCPIWMICARVKDAERSAQFLAQAADLRPLQVAFSDGGGGWANLDAG